MNNILIKSQDGNFTGFCKYIGIGRRTPKTVIGDELKALLEEKKMTRDDLVNLVGNSYRDNINRILENQEQPKPKLVELIIAKLGVEKDYFVDNKDLENIIVTDNNIVIATYESNDRARKVKEQLDEIIINNTRSGNPVVIEMPKE